MLVSSVNAIKENISDITEQNKLIKDLINNTLNDYLVRATVKLEHIDLSTFFSNHHRVEGFRQLFTQDGNNYSWWGVKINDAPTLYGLEYRDKGIKNIWLSELPTTDNGIKMINMLRIAVHNDLI